MRPEPVELAFDWRGLRLVGTLHLPAGAGPHPGVLMAQGSGPSDRESGGYFEPIRETFVERGVATFAFDKPGCGESGGDWRHFGLEDRADQLVIALEQLRNHPAVSEERVGLWGHSQGGWLVQKLAGRATSLAFAIAGSAPTISVQEQIVYDCEHTMRNLGHSQEQTLDAMMFTRSLQQAAVDGASFPWVSEQLLAPASRHAWYDSFQTVEDADDWLHLSLLVCEVHEPVSDLEVNNCPFLAVYGGLDVLLPVWQGIEESGRALAAAQSRDVSVVVFPFGDHRMQHAATKEFVDGYLDLLGEWVASRVC